MGKTSKPLTIVALPPCDRWEELEKLEAQGHTVYRATEGSISFADLVGADIVLGSNCWRMDNQHKPYLALAIKEARVLRYPKNEDRADSKKRTSADDDIGLESDDKSST